MVLSSNPFITEIQKLPIFDLKLGLKPIQPTVRRIDVSLIL